MQARRFYIDIQQRAFVNGPNTDLPRQNTEFTRSDTETIELYFVDRVSSFGFDFADYSGNSIKVAIGNQGNPTEGTFKISDDTATTTALPYTVTAGQLKAALDAMDTSTGIFGGGPCTVTGQMPRFIVTVGSDNLGVIGDLQTDDNELVPSTEVSFIQRQAATATKPLIFDLVFQRQPAVLTTTFTPVPTTVTASVTTLVEGNTNTSEQQRYEFNRLPVEGTYSLTFPARTITVISATASTFVAPNHGLYNDQLVTLSGFTISPSSVSNTGYYVTARTRDTFKITTIAGGSAVAFTNASVLGTAQLDAITTPPIPFNADASLIEAIIASTGINDGGVSQIAVNGVVGEHFILTFGNGSSAINFPLTQVTASSLEAARGMSGTLDFNTIGVRDLITNEENESLTMEVEVIATGSSTQTYTTTASIDSDIITQTSQPSPPTTTYSQYFMRVETGVTGLQGGGSSKLDGLVTANGTYPVGIVVFILISGVPQMWQLTAGTQATNLGNGILRPVDYATTTNEKVWLQRM